MTFDVLLSAMHLEDETYIDSLNIKSNAVVINQCDRDTQTVIARSAVDASEQTVVYVESPLRGLSVSRNMAISKSEADICILCDNDVEYEDDYIDTVIGSFEKYKDADVIVFFIKRPERQVPVFTIPKRMHFLSVLKIFSPEIAFRRQSVSDIKFNESFGAGAHYKMGEENIFLYDCLKAGKKIMYVPTQIAHLRSVESTWFAGYDRDFFVSRGANYEAMSKTLSLFLIWQFALRKRSLYLEKISMKEALSAMFEGRKEWKKQSKKKA